MSNQVPFTAFCPECNGHRTFTILGAPNSHTWQPDMGAWVPDRNVGCCVCGTSERGALVAVSARMTDDAATIGEISARINTLDGEVEELREHALEQSRAIDRQRESFYAFTNSIRPEARYTVTDLHSRRV